MADAAPVERPCAMRRALLLGPVGAGIAAIVSGCGASDHAPDVSAGKHDQAAGAAGPSSSAVASAEPSYEPWPGTGGGSGSGLVKTADVPVGGAVRVDRVLVAQPQRGVFKAYDATCPHQGFVVDTPLDGTDYFNCPGHNSKFRLADGSRISGPAPRGLRQVAVKVKGGYVVTT
jgi:nitrite reductase/ring-hydroxylating ferredoxin subunit